MKHLFPYPVLYGSVELDVVSVSVDSRGLPYTQISTVERAVALHQTGRTEWEVATLQLKAMLPDAELDAGPWSDPVCLAILSESATNTRSTAPLFRDPDGDWRGSIDLVRGRHVNRASLAVHVVGEVDGIAGRVIGASERDWYIDLREATPRRQREIRIEQTDFREGPHEWLRPFKDASWIIETVDDIPVVYLNTAGVEGLMEIINGTGGSPSERLLRDMTASQIAQDAWIAMFHTAISDLDLDDDGTPIMPTGWREPVVRMMLPDVLPGRQLTDALFEINNRRTTGAGWPELQTNIQYAAGKRSQITKKLTNAVRTVHRAGGNGTG